MGSICPDALTKLLACCNADTGCQALYMSSTETDLNQRLVAVGSNLSNKYGGSTVSNLMGHVMSLACDGDCQNSVAVMKVMDPCDHGFVLSSQTMTCQQFGQPAPFFNDSSSLFFTSVFFVIVLLIFVLLGLLFFKLRGRRPGMYQ